MLNVEKSRSGFKFQTKRKKKIISKQTSRRKKTVNNLFLYPHDTTIQRRLPVPFFSHREPVPARFIWRRKTEIYELRLASLLQTHREKTHGEKNVNKQARALAIFNSKNSISIALGEVREKSIAAVDKIEFKFIF